MIKNNKILVTGSSGFIGYHLCKLLLENNWKVAGVDGHTDYYDINLKKSRCNELIKSKKFVPFFGMLEDKNFISNCVDTFKPSIIIHLAAQAGVRYSIENPRSYIDSNIIGTFNILEISKNFKIKHLLVASSSSVYGSIKIMPFNEKQKCDYPISFYAASKKANEVMCHSYSYLHSIPITMLRFFTAYGPYGRPDMALFKFTNLIRQNKQISVYNNGLMKRDFTYVSDVVKSINLLINIIPEKPNQRQQNIKSDSISNVAPWRVVNIGSSNPINLIDFITLIEKELRTSAKKKLLPMQTGDVLETWACCKLLEDLTGFKPQTKINLGIKRFIDWHLSYY